MRKLTVSRGTVGAVLTLAFLVLAIACSPTTSAPTPAAAPAKAPAAAPAPTTAAAPAKAPAAAAPTPAVAAAPAKAPAAAQPKPQATMPRGLTMQGGSAPGTAGDIETAWWEDQIKKVYPDIAIRRMPGGFNEGAFLVESGQVDISIFGVATADAAWNQKIDFFKFPYRKLRALYARSSPLGGLEFVVLDKSPIKSVSDIRNKRVGVGPKTIDEPFLIEGALKAVYGFGYDDIKAAGGLVQFAPQDQVTSQVAEGKLDVSMRYGPQVTPYWQAIDKAQPLRWLDLEDKFLQYFKDAYGWSDTFTMLDVYTLYKDKPAKEYTKRTVNGAIIMGVNADMPDDVAYNTIKAVMGDDKGDSFMMKFRKEWQRIDPPFRLGDNATQARTIPFHPGAVKYWTEKGFKLPEPALK